MHRETLPPDSSSPWANLNNIELNGVKISLLQKSRGSGVVATRELSEDNAVLMTIPQELLLSLDNVWVYAKADRYLREVLEAVGDYARTARGAILIFLLMQITSSSAGIPVKIGASNPWAEYVKFLPSEYPLPTFWNEAERKLFHGTSLSPALEAKLKSLDREFTHLRESTKDIEWCKYWWDADVGRLSFNDWKTVDAMFRSRALDLPGTGHAMVPYIDMANHASGEGTVALYDTDANGNGILVLRDGKRLQVGEEVTITYGDEKGACEMLFSYGFIEGNMHGEDVDDDILSTREMFLGIDIPDDDPLKHAKRLAFDAPTGFRIFSRDGDYEWEGPFVWLSCINEEDGLSFQVLQLNNGERELKAAWNVVEIQGIQMLEKCLQTDPLWDIFQLRATVLVQNRIKRQIQNQEDNMDYVEEARIGKMPVSFQNFKAAEDLLNRELFFLSMAWNTFERRRTILLNSRTVQEYFNHASANEEVDIDDFS